MSVAMALEDVSGVGSVAPLGIYGKIAATEENSAVGAIDRLSVVRQRFAHQNTARKLIPWHPIKKCMLWTIPGSQGVELHYLPEFQRGKIRRLMLCRSPWVCPCCSSIISERRRRDLHGLDQAARSQGLRVLMVTLTFRHKRYDSLAAILAAFLASLRKLTAQRAYKSLRSASGMVGWLRALEVTHSDRNGWHPHAHILCYVAGDMPTVDFAAEFSRLWAAALRSVGLDCSAARGCRVDDTDQRITRYLAKYGREPRWDEAAEVTKSHVKRGRYGSRTPFDLLRAAHSGDIEAGRLFAEFAEAFKGRHQLSPSPGLYELLRVPELRSDDELMEESDTVTTLLGFLLRDGWRRVVGQDARAELQTALDTGSLEDVSTVLEVLGVPAWMLIPAGATQDKAVC